MAIAVTTVAQVDFAAALKAGPPPVGNLAVPIFAHGALVVELYTPKSASRPRRWSGQRSVGRESGGSGFASRTWCGLRFRARRKDLASIRPSSDAAPRTKRVSG